MCRSFDAKTPGSLPFSAVSSFKNSCTSLSAGVSAMPQSWHRPQVMPSMGAQAPTRHLYAQKWRSGSVTLTFFFCKGRRPL